MSNTIFPKWARNLTIYEVNLRQYTPSGTIQEFRTHLPRLKALGVGILWFMPIQPIGKLNRKGTKGSYYSISNYCAVNEEFGTLQQFVDLVKEIHEMGMYVILDWVANHTAWDHVWVQQHPDFYRRNELGNVFPPFPEWEDVIGLDYNNIALRKEMVAEMAFWVKTADIDGFRCDMAHLVPTSFWEEARIALEKLKPLFMLAEAELRELADKAFNVLYNWNLFHVFNDIAQGRYTAEEIRWRIPSEIINFPKQADNMLFISNHDENSWNGSELERLGLALETFAVLIFTLPGMPLIYSGQEAGNPKRLSFFEKDTIEWKADKMERLYTKFTRLRLETPALWSTQPTGSLQLVKTDNDSRIFAFIRELDNSKVLVILNLSNAPVNFSLLEGNYQGEYLDYLKTGLKLTIGAKPCFHLAAWDYSVYKLESAAAEEIGIRKLSN